MSSDIEVEEDIVDDDIPNEDEIDDDDLGIYQEDVMEESDY